MSDADLRLWDRMQEALRSEHPEICRQWFEEIEPLGVVGATCHLRAQSRIHRDYLRRQCAAPFVDAARIVSGQLLSVMFLGPGEGVPPSDGVLARSTMDSGSNSAIPDTVTLDPDNAFASFVTGPGNRYAHAAAEAVAENPGGSYNPLFIHGGVGLGKTHLLQAIGLRVQELWPDIVIQYFSCESFVTQFTEAIRAGQMTEFRHWFRDADILVIDDIHFLADKEGSQEEFFHTFNTLYQEGKQIVLSSDAPPESIPDLEERLVSRFKWGLVTEVEPPDYETRVAIVKSKAVMRGIEIPDEVACLVAARIDNNIRELEGAITKLQIHANVEKTPINLELAKLALGEEVRAPTCGATIQTIIEAVTDFYSVRLTDLQSRKRQRSIALPRQICMFLARRHTRHSLEEIGGYFGGRDHTTVMHAVKAIETRCADDDQFELVVNNLEERLVESDA